jgi:uncharacterized protein (DUF885 family)
MVRRNSISIAILCALAGACGGGRPPDTPKGEPAASRAKALADAYLAGFFARNPDQVTLYGVPGRRHDKLPDNSIESLRAWQAKEDAWLTEAQQIDPAAIDTAPVRATYAIAREAFEGSIAARVCRNELWGVSQFVNGWQVQDGYLVTIQPVGSDEARHEALARWSSLPKYIDTEIANLRAGLTAGYPRRRATSASSSIR